MRSNCIKLILRIMIFTSLVVIPAAAAHAYVLDGDLSDWGVTPFSDWIPNSSRIDWREADDTNKYPNGGLGIRTSGFVESRDYEALYFDNDDNYFYWAMVSSVPFDPAYSRVHPYPEDMAIDANGDGINELGLEVGLLGARTDNGPPVTRGVYDVSRWRRQSNADFDIMSGTQIGTYEIFNRALGEVEPWEGSGSEPRDVGTGFGWTARTYILEARIDRLLFGDLEDGDMLRLFFAKYECITDYIWVDGTIDPTNGGVIPEPTTMILFGSSLIGFAGLRLKKRKTTNA